MNLMQSFLALNGEPNFIAIAVIGAVAVIAAIAVVIKIAYNKGVEEAFEEEAAPIKRTAPKKKKPREHRTDDGAVIAAITAAVSMVLASEGKDPRGFRVVSFKRSKK